MNKLSKILELLGICESQLEDQIFQSWFLWCQEKSYILQKKQPFANAMALELSLPDLQNLLADATLFNYFKKMYMDCMDDFFEDTKGMNPPPNRAEARILFKQCTIECHRLYSMDLINKARNKKIIEYVNN